MRRLAYVKYLDVTVDAATAFAVRATARARAARSGRAREPGRANRTWRLADMLPEALERIEALGRAGGTGISRVPTGLADLDALTHGLQPGSLVVVGAGPAIGKFTLLLDFCRSATLRHSLPSALFSLDMTRQELGMRLLSAEARVPMHVLRGGLMSDDDRTRLARRMADITDAPLYVNDTRLLTVQALCEEATRLIRDHGVGLIVELHRHGPTATITVAFQGHYSRFVDMAPG
jgi:replicative DNA helicase